MVEIVEDEIPEDIQETDQFDEAESDDPICAVEDALDSHGQFRREADGTLKFEEFLKFK